LEDHYGLSAIRSSVEAAKHLNQMGAMVETQSSRQSFY